MPALVAFESDTRTNYMRQVTKIIGTESSQTDWLNQSGMKDLPNFYAS